MQLTIQLSGVAAVGPGWPRRKKGSGKVRGPLYAVMPSSSRRQNAWSVRNPQERREFLPVHFPVVVTDSHDWDPLQRPPDVEPTDVNGWSIWYPRRERLEFVVDDDEKSGDIIFEHSPDADDGGSPDGDVHHVADMRRVWPDRAKLRRSVRPGRRVSAPVPNTVAAQVLISKGYVTSAFRRPGRWKARFDPIHTSNRQQLVQCLAPELLITREVKQKVEIRSWSLDTGKQLDSIVFRPSADLSIRVGNADPADFFAWLGGNHLRARQMPADSARDGRRDFDFELYYDLLQGKTTTDLSVPIDYDPTVGFVRNCYLVFVEE